jgi:hypothetical protein
MYRVCTPRREIGDISACAALQWEARSHPIVQSGNAAPRPMKTGNARSRLHYDAMRGDFSLYAEARHSHPRRKWRKTGDLLAELQP